MDSENTFSPPYGPPANIKMILETWRDRSMPEMVTREWLERIGISTHLTAKNLHALRFLGLIDEAGYTTPVAQRLRTATSEEYPSVLEEIVRKAYRRVFEIRDPSVDSRTRIDDAFRHELPQAQRPRMVACFLGLCTMAGIPLKEAPPLRETGSRRGTTPIKRVRLAEPSMPRAEVIAVHPPPRIEPGGPEPSSPLNPVLAGLLRTVPQIESAEDLDEWYQVFRAAFLFVKNMAAKTRSEAGA